MRLVFRLRKIVIPFTTSARLVSRARCRVVVTRPFIHRRYQSHDPRRISERDPPVAVGVSLAKDVGDDALGHPRGDPREAVHDVPQRDVPPFVPVERVERGARPVACRRRAEVPRVRGEPRLQNARKCLSSTSPLGHASLIRASSAGVGLRPTREMNAHLRSCLFSHPLSPESKALKLAATRAFTSASPDVLVPPRLCRVPRGAAPRGRGREGTAVDMSTRAFGEMRPSTASIPPARARIRDASEAGWRRGVMSW